MTEWDHAESREVDHVIGAFYLVRRVVFEDLHGFDERFFMYLEDVDFSLRARRAGWLTYYLAEATAYHHGGGSSQAIGVRRLFYSWWSRLLYATKHFSTFGSGAVIAGTLLVEPFVRVLTCAARGSRTGIRDTVAASSMLWRRWLMHVAAPPLGGRSVEDHLP
jgi:GT2 family glycosyltransferase